MNIPNYVITRIDIKLPMTWYTLFIILLFMGWKREKTVGHARLPQGFNIRNHLLQTLQKSKMQPSPANTIGGALWWHRLIYIRDIWKTTKIISLKLGILLATASRKPDTKLRAMQIQNRWEDITGRYPGRTAACQVDQAITNLNVSP